MNLYEIFPTETLKTKFTKEVNIVYRSREALAEISRLKSSCMIEIGGGAWDRYVNSHPTCDSQALAEYFQNNDPRLYQRMERHTGKKVLHDVSYTVARVDDETLGENLCAELLLAVVYPKLLRISDITFCDPYNKINEEEKKYKFQEYKGLGLFPELMENCEKFCNENGITEICMAAAYIDLVPFFEQYGFSVEDTPAGRAYLEYEYGIPMSKLVA